jgi:hypothetical protein
MVGNGESNDTRNNAFTVNKDGNAYVQNNKKLATEEYVNEKLSNGAEPVDTIKIRDRATAQIYNLYIENGELKMEEVAE